MKKWKVESFNTPLNKIMQANFRVVEDDKNSFPICNLPCSTSKKQSETLIEKQNEYATLIAAAPDLLAACKEALRFVTPEEEAYDTLNNAINKATVKQ